MATRYDPFQEMDRMLASLLGAERASATMPMDLYRSGDHYVLHIDLPGVDPGTIDVNVEDRTLTISAERTANAEDDAQWLARERPSGTYARQLTVGRGLALDAIAPTRLMSITVRKVSSGSTPRLPITRPGVATPAQFTTTRRTPCWVAAVTAACT